MHRRRQCKRAARRVKRHCEILAGSDRILREGVAQGNGTGGDAGRVTALQQVNHFMVNSVYCIAQTRFSALLRLRGEGGIRYLCQQV
jgi:hypothetical protein